MNISGVSKTAYHSVTGLNFRRHIFDLLPNMNIGNPATMNKIGTILGRPDVNRGIMGGTAMLTQPFIDYNNHKVDHETAAVSTCRTVSKIIAGTSVGIAVRWLCYHAVNACTSLDPKAPAWKKWLMPSQQTIQKISKRNVDWFKNYKNTLATILGLAAMLVTNFALDVPLTNWLSKKFVAIHKNRAGKKNQQESVNNVANPTNQTPGIISRINLIDQYINTHKPNSMSERQVNP